MKDFVEMLVAHWMWLPFLGSPALAIGAAIARAAGKKEAADRLARDAEIMASGSDHQVSS